MNRIQVSLISLAVTGAACTAFYLTRGSRIAAMETALAEKRAIVSKLEGPDTTPAIRAQAAGSGTLSVQQAVKKTAAIVQAHADQDVTLASYSKAVNELLHQIADLPPANLLALADSIDAPVSGDDLPMPGRLKQLLLRLAAEHDPAALLARPDIARNTDLLAGIFSSLATKDSAAAMRWLDASDFDEREKEVMEKLLIRAACKVDFREALRIAAERAPGGDAFALVNNNMPLRQGVLEQAAASLSDAPDKATRASIVEMVMSSAAFHSGVEGMRDIAAKNSIPNEDIAAYLTSPAGRRKFDSLDPVQALGWIDEVLNDEQRKTAVPDLMKSWAKRDYNAAGSYLGKMPPSEIKNLSVANFASTVAPLDPPAAALWALEISDTESRKTTLDNVIRQWHRTDPEAADAWLQARGIQGSAISTKP